MDSEIEALVASENARTRAFADLLAGRSDIQRPPEADDAHGFDMPSPASAPPITEAEILEIVRQRQSLMLEYFVMEDQLFIWIISPSGDVETISVDVSRTVLEQSVAEFVDLVDREAPSTEALSRILSDLYTHLIAPIPAELLPTSPEEVLTIIPHDVLFRVPFGALLDESETYFIERQAIAYAPSIDVLDYTRQFRNRALHPDAPGLLAFVNPKPLGDDGYADLALTEQYFDQIGQLYPDEAQHTILKAEEATLDALRREAPQHSVLYFATHAEAFETDPLESFIALAKPGESDRFLRVPDIFQLSLRCDLVILAACRTGVGEITGDGVNGLSRAFIWAGAPTLLMSLWQVPEETSLQLMGLFHQYWLEQGLSKAQALRQAQVELLQSGFNREQPDLWAGFILFGETEEYSSLPGPAAPDGRSLPETARPAPPDMFGETLTETLTLTNDEPLPDSEVLVALEIFSEEGRMGDSEMPPKRVREGQVSLGKSRIVDLQLPEDSNRPPFIGNSADWDYYLIIIPFTLHEPSGYLEDRYYRRVTFGVNLTDERVTAFDLFPEKITAKVETNQSYGLSSNWKFMAVEDDRMALISSDGLQPTITAFGLGQNEFYWTYENQDQGVALGTKYALVILETPSGTEVVTGSVYYNLVVEKKLLAGIWRPKEARTDTYSLEWALDEAERIGKP